LRTHLVQGPGASPMPAQSLGRHAVALGLETLDLVEAHERAMATLVSPHASPKTRASTNKRAREFFAEAAIRIENTHRAATEANALIRQLSRTLRQRTRASSVSNRRLRRTILQRRAAEEAIKKGEQRHTKLLAESRRLLQHLRRLARGSLSAQEDDRKSVSHQLHNEIAQGLLGIHVRILTLNKAVKAGTKTFEKEVAGTQRLVRDSDRMVRRLAHECGMDDGR
jgi:signal transduction histidine kinase